jgi:hypothetical protein
MFVGPEGEDHSDDEGGEQYYPGVNSFFGDDISNWKPGAVPAKPDPYSSLAAPSAAAYASWPEVVSAGLSLSAGDVVAFQQLELASNWMPEVSDYRQGTVVRSVSMHSGSEPSDGASEPVIEVKLERWCVSEHSNGGLQQVCLQVDTLSNLRKKPSCC